MLIVPCNTSTKLWNGARGRSPAASVSLLHALRPLHGAKYSIFLPIGITRGARSKSLVPSATKASFRSTRNPTSRSAAIVRCFGLGTFGQQARGLPLLLAPTEYLVHTAAASPSPRVEHSGMTAEFGNYYTLSFHNPH